MTWKTWPKRRLKAELREKGLSYRDLAQRLGEATDDETVQVLINRVNRGSFSASFFVRCLAAMGCKTLHIDVDDTNPT
jgi:hypothetical protein